MLPKRRFWKPENHFGPPVWALFQGCEYSFWTTLAWKCAQNDGPKCFQGFQNLRLGEHKFESIKLRNYLVVTISLYGYWGISNRLSSYSHSMPGCGPCQIETSHRQLYAPQTKSERTFWNAFSKYFSNERSPNWELTPLKRTSKCFPKRSFGNPKSSFGEHKLTLFWTNLPFHEFP